MEDLRHLYSLPYDPHRPVVCIDERPCFLIGDVLMPVPMEAGQPKRVHYEYEQHGSCTVFLAVEPLTGRRWVQVYKQRTGQEYALFMQYLAQHFKAAQKIVLVQDNLSTHTPASFYAHLRPTQALKVMMAFEFHFTPVKSRWLNMAEIELSALSRQCLARRIASQIELEREVRIWAKKRTQRTVKVTWQFSIQSARQKFAGKYPMTTS
jgi:DDE superfamily endonuclease